MRASCHRRFAIAALAAAGSLALAASPAAAGDGGFTGALDLPLVRPASLAVGDFNNDGRPDLSVVSDGLGKVAIFLQTPSGELVAGSPVEAGDYPGLVEVADFNRDGNEDLAVTNLIDAQVSIRLGVGDGSFRIAPAVDLGTGHIPRDLAVGDFDSDTRDDLAVATIPPAPPNVVRIRMGVGNGTFAPAAPVNVKAVAALAVGDAVAGRLRATATVRAAAGQRSVALPARSLRVAAGAGRTVALALPARAGRELTRRGSLTLRLTAQVRDPAGNSRRVTRRARIRLAPTR